MFQQHDPYFIFLCTRKKHNINLSDEQIIPLKYSFCLQNMRQKGFFFLSFVKLLVGALAAAEREGKQHSFGGRA